ncbi:MAG: flagellar basal body-associated FliL family protein [Pseudomonadota bacterium]
MRLILPILLIVLGVVGGGAAGYYLKPAPEAGDEEMITGDAKPGAEMLEPVFKDEGVSMATDSAYVPIEQKLIVPIRRSNGRKAFVAMDATLEISPDSEEWIKSHEPKTVDAFLRVLIAFAATGAFDDHAETAMALDDLNDALLTSAQTVLGESVRAVLISNLITQDA